jgi:hypothetical protein
VAAHDPGEIERPGGAFMTHRRIILALTAIVAAALLVPAAASARPFKVSHDVGVYAGTSSTSKGLATVKSGGTVDVQCWTTGQSIGGYAIWDRVSVRNISGYVHDKYVEMPNKTSPAANGIPRCKGGGQPAPAPKPGPGRCVGQKWTQYLAEVLPNPDPKGVEGWSSWYRVRWTATFCPVGNGDYRFEGTPEVREYTNRLSALKALDFQLGEPDPSPDRTRVLYEPRLRICPLTKHLPGACFTGAKMRMMVRLIGGRVRFDRSVVTTKPGLSVMTPNHLGWRHKQDQGKGPSFP